MWPSAVRTFNRPSGIQIVCLGYLWIHRNVDKKYFFEYENSEKNKNMICGIHRKLMSSQGAALIVGVRVICKIYTVVDQCCYNNYLHIK